MNLITFLHRETAFLASPDGVRLGIYRRWEIAQSCNVTDNVGSIDGDWKTIRVAPPTDCLGGEVVQEYIGPQRFTLDTLIDAEAGPVMPDAVLLVTDGALAPSGKVKQQTPVII